MIKTLILYESRYGCTERISKDLALILGPAKVCRVSEFKGRAEDFDFVVICSPVYFEAVDGGILKFVKDNEAVIRRKKVALLCVCMAANLADRYLEPLSNLLGDCVVMKSAAGGEIDTDKLSSSDRELMESFFKKIGSSSGSVSRFDKNSFAELALRIKSIKDAGNIRMENEILKRYIDDFLKQHNTCVLATGKGDRVRATPIEYMYLGGCIYILSEGGEKFANIILNSNVSVGIADPYKGMEDLAGMQISGTAELIQIGSDEYKYVLGQRKIEYEKILSLPMALNLLKIKISKAEYLWSGFGKLGCDVKQTFMPY